MRRLEHDRVKKRTFILVSFSILWLLVILFRLIQLQVLNHSRLKAVVLEQNQNIDWIVPKRGTIFDRSGSILARSIPKFSVFYTPFQSESVQLQMEKIQRLKKILDLSAKELQAIEKRIKKNDSFIWIKRKIEPEQANLIKQYQLTGIGFEEENKRFYPHGKLASQIIGRVNIDDEGASGIEYRFNSVLEGEKGKRLILRDAKRRKYRLEILKDPIPGNDIVLCIDETIQYIAEKEIAWAVHKTQANWGTVIVCRPLSGEILAVANCPSFNLNEASSFPLKWDRNKAIHFNFDPGSTFKVITASAALESKKVSLNDTFDCSAGTISIAGKSISDHQRFGILTFPEVFIHSSNVGAVQIGTKVGQEHLYRTIKAFGFGEKTGIDLPAEEKGLFSPLERWTEISPASLSIGYEISVTAIQMLQAINVIANRGLWIPPRIVKNVPSHTENHEEGDILSRRIISEETAYELTRILVEAVNSGTGKKARINGYTVAGKTGTAQKIDPSSGSYTSSSHTASFMGFVPADAPVLSIIVVLDGPKGDYYGGVVSAPVFQEIGKKVLRYLKIPRQTEPKRLLITAKSSEWGHP